MIRIQCATGHCVDIVGDTLVAADLSGRDLHRAALGSFDLTGANLQQAILRNADLRGALLNRCNLQNCAMMLVEAQGASFVGADLSGSQLNFANLEGADLRQARLANANVIRANFRRSRLEGADMRCLELPSADISEATWDATTLWPEGFVPRASFENGALALKYDELLHQVLWADSAFERMEADYEEVRLLVRDPGKRAVRLRAISHIALSWNGHWDESILDGVELSERDEAIEHALQRVRESYGDRPGRGGGVRELSGPWFVLRLRFIDGATIEVVAQRLELEILE